MKQAVPQRPSSSALWLPGEPQLEEYAELLATRGIERGLIGPREVPRLWERHLLNCAAVALDPAVPIASGATVIDVGSGAGLPGIVWALVRPDLSVTLMEPKLRRFEFLHEVVGDLGLSERVRIVRIRAEDATDTPPADVVTARAVAPLDVLVGWCLPLLNPTGRIVALKGEGAAAELCSAEPVLRSLSARGVLASAGRGWLGEPTRLIIVEREVR